MRPRSTLRPRTPRWPGPTRAGSDNPHEDGGAEQQGDHMQRPDRLVVQLKHPPVNARRKQQEISKRGRSTTPTSAASRHGPPCAGACASSGSMPARRGHVLAHVRDAGGRRNGAGDRRMRHDELQQTTCAQLARPISAAHAGSGDARAAGSDAPCRNGRLTITAMPRSRASGRMRASTSRSRTL